MHVPAGEPRALGVQAQLLMGGRMLEFIPSELHVDFIGQAKFYIALSLLVILAGLGSMLWRGGLHLGVDFRGGTLLQLRFSRPVELREVRDVLGPLGFGQAILQHFGNEHEVLIRISQLPNAGQDIAVPVQQALQARFPEQKVELRRAEVVGPQASETLRRQALFAMFYAIAGILVYVSGRFEAKWMTALGLGVVLFAMALALNQWLPGVSPTVLIVMALLLMFVFCWVLDLSYAFAAIIPLIHDVLVTVGFLSLFDQELDLTIVAALLTIVGYSINDTIVIFDRIRENRQSRRRDDFALVVNDSINQTLGRTILTSATVLMVVLALFFFGGEVIHGFAFAMLVGVIAGVYSTIFIASPILISWHAYTQRHQTRRARMESGRS
jgi:preprotein translocase subunit SecF